MIIRLDRLQSPPAPVVRPGRPRCSERKPGDAPLAQKRGGTVAHSSRSACATVRPDEPASLAPGRGCQRPTPGGRAGGGQAGGNGFARGVMSGGLRRPLQGDAAQTARPLIGGLPRCSSRPPLPEKRSVVERAAPAHSVTSNSTHVPRGVPQQKIPTTATRRCLMRQSSVESHVHCASAPSKRHDRSSPLRSALHETIARSTMAEKS